MYIHYELVLKGHRSVYLGPSVPKANLELLQNLYENITFVSYFTVKPEQSELSPYIDNFSKDLLRDEKDKLWILGQKIKDVSSDSYSKKVELFKKIDELLHKI